MSQRKSFKFNEKTFIESQAFSHEDAFGFAPIALASLESTNAQQSKPAKTTKPSSATQNLNQSVFFKSIQTTAEKWGKVGFGMDLSNLNNKKNSTPSIKR